MTTFSATFDDHGLSERLDKMSLTRAMVTFTDLVTAELLTSITAATPVGDGPSAGKLAHSHRSKRKTSSSSVEMTIFTNVYYDPFVIHGAHIPAMEKPGNGPARAFHWTGPSGDVFSMSTKAHDIPANNYPLKAWGASREFVIQTMLDVLHGELIEGEL